MRVLIFHGYLLRGTGSNVYTASAARALAALGHEVHLLCQERTAAELAWVDAVGEWAPELAVRRVRQAARPGEVTVYTPDIGGLLPVYVLDRYEGFRAETFSRLTDAELDAYLAANVSAVRDVLERVGGVDAALSNHLVMGPAILARAGLEFAAKIHGSALEYTVKPAPDRFLPFASEGLARARCVLVGSRHTAESLWAAVADPGLPARTRLGPPGVDVAEFRPAAGDPAAATDALARRLDGSRGGAFGRDPAAAGALRAWTGGSAPRAVYVGKLIAQKGVDLLLAAWPLVHRDHPGSRLLVVGFGEGRAATESLWLALARADLDTASCVARGLEPAASPFPEPLPILGRFLADPPAGYAEAGAAAAGSVLFSGRLEHHELASVLPAAAAAIVPSTFPEAFGMVAAEAAACGVPPVCADHSGLREVVATLDADLPEGLPPLRFDVGEGAVERLAALVSAWLGVSEGERTAAAAALAGSARRHWSWEGVARGVLAAAQGELDGLPAVPRH